MLSYHSLEDRLVKNALRDAATDRVPPGMPAVPEPLRAQLRLLTRGAERPDADEEQDNPGRHRRGSGRPNEYVR